MSIHGKIQSTTLENDNKQIVFTLKDGVQHKYLYNNNSIFFILFENDEEKKYITLCENLDSCIFTYETNRLNTKIKIGDITYNNNFNV